jgi:Flp pilus assembly protein TadD
MIGVLAALMVCAWQQTSYWHDSETLWTRTLACTTNNTIAYDNLGAVLRQKGRMDEAISEFQKALRIQPNDADSHNNLGTVLRQKGKIDEAISEYRLALQTNPALAEAHYNLGIAFLQKGDTAQAISEYQEALRIDPANTKVQNNLAWLLATCADASLRNGDQAVELARQANEPSAGTDPVILDTLAAALAEAGRFDDAARTAEKALELARVAGQQDLVKELNGELKRYAAGLPCRP